MSAPELDAAAPALHALRDRLLELGYREEHLKRALELDELASLALPSLPYLLATKLSKGSGLDAAIALLFLQQPLGLAEAEAALGAGAIQALDDLGMLLVDRGGGRCWSAFTLTPIGERLFFSDHRFAQLPGWRAPPEQPVMAPGLDSLLLARGLIREPATSVLDLCTGSGALALLAGARATAVDVSERAVRVAALNAVLNDLPCEFLAGDLYEPVAGRRFDLILANPPFVPAPSQRVLYRDGGPDGAAVLKRVLAGLAAHLNPGGRAQIVAQVGERTPGDSLARVRGWLEGAPLDLHCLRVREETAAELATRNAWGDDFGAYSRSVREWADNLAAQGITRAVLALFTLSPASGEPRNDSDVASYPASDFGEQLNQLIGSRRAPLESLALVDDAELIDRSAPDGTYRYSTLSVQGPLRREIALDAAERGAVVQLARGRRPADELLIALANKGALRVTSS